MARRKKAVTRVDSGKFCKDCLVEGVQARRPTPYPGPRCTTHHRSRSKSVSEARWENYILATYNITSEQYWAIYEAQGGCCALCRRATGKAKRLSIDHDHTCCPGKTSCGRCVRSLICRTCNIMLGHSRDDPEFFTRAALYLLDPPGRNWIYDNLFD